MKSKLLRPPGEHLRDVQANRTVRAGADDCKWPEPAKFLPQRPLGTTLLLSSVDLCGAADSGKIGTGVTTGKCIFSSLRGGRKINESEMAAATLWTAAGVGVGVGECEEWRAVTLPPSRIPGIDLSHGTGTKCWVTGRRHRASGGGPRAVTWRGLDHNNDAACSARGPRRFLPRLSRSSSMLSSAPRWRRVASLRAPRSGFSGRPWRRGLRLSPG